MKNKIRSIAQIIVLFIAIGLFTAILLRNPKHTDPPKIKINHKPNDTILVINRDGWHVYINTDSTHYTVIPPDENK